MSGAVINRYLTRAEEKTLLARVGRDRDDLAQRDYYWMEALRSSGLRINAFAQLSVGDAQQALAQRHLCPRPATQKRHKTQQILVTQRLDRALRGLLRIHKRMAGPLDPDAPLVLGRRGTRLTIRSYQLRMAYWCREAGLAVTASPHWWRHTVAVRLLETSTAQQPLLVVQHALNHADLRSTAHYLKPTREQIAHDMESANR